MGVSWDCKPAADADLLRPVPAKGLAHPPDVARVGMHLRFPVEGGAVVPPVVRVEAHDLDVGQLHQAFARLDHLVER